MVDDTSATLKGSITIDDPRASDVRELLAQHLTFANTHSLPEDVHALDIQGLLDPAVTFYSFRRNGELLGVGALMHLDQTHAEIKSMHTAQSARGTGVGRAMVEHLISVARRRGYHRLSLETGTVQAFAPARRLYAKAGFKPCEPFGQYRAGRQSCCMTLSLREARSAIED